MVTDILPQVFAAVSHHLLLVSQLVLPVMLVSVLMPRRTSTSESFSFSSSLRLLVCTVWLLLSFCPISHPPLLTELAYRTGLYIQIINLLHPIYSSPFSLLKHNTQYIHIFCNLIVKVLRRTFLYRYLKLPYSVIFISLFSLPHTSQSCWKIESQKWCKIIKSISWDLYLKWQSFPAETTRHAKCIYLLSLNSIPIYYFKRLIKLN